MPSDWYPTTLAALIPWHANFNANVQATGTTYGLNAAQKAAVLDDADTVLKVVNYKEAVEAYKQAVTEWAEIWLRAEIGTPVPPMPTPPTPPTISATALAAVEDRTRQYAAIMKADPEYNDEIGELYGIVAPAAPAPGTPSAEAFALTQSQIRLLIAKAGYNLVAVDSRRAGGQWEQIGVAQVSEFIDMRAPLVAGQPELREYRVQGMENNVRVGALSDVVSAVTVP